MRQAGNGLSSITDHQYLNPYLQGGISFVYLSINHRGNRRKQLIAWTTELDHLSSNPSSAAYYLCDLGQVT